MIFLLRNSPQPHFLRSLSTSQQVGGEEITKDIITCWEHRKKGLIG